MCPALMLANSRKHKVKGRTRILTISTNLRKGTKYQGEFEGRRAEEENFLFKSKKMLNNQKENAAPKLNAKVVVTGYL